MDSPKIVATFKDGTIIPSNSYVELVHHMKQASTNYENNHQYMRAVIKNMKNNGLIMCDNLCFINTELSCNEFVKLIEKLNLVVIQEKKTLTGRRKTNE